MLSAQFGRHSVTLSTLVTKIRLVEVYTIKFISTVDQTVLQKYNGTSLYCKRESYNTTNHSFYHGHLSNCKGKS